MSFVYLLHFDSRYKHAGHYIGTAYDLVARMREHRAGRGARLVEVIQDAGITWKVARLWRGSRRDERRLKTLGGARRICPICTPGTHWGECVPALEDGERLELLAAIEGQQ